ncbi:MAG: CheR family methyltransferase [Candidatus Lokiarchaeia archaeon]
MFKISSSVNSPQSIDALIEELKSASGMNFQQYQRKFLEKRIDFRMKNLNLDFYQDYVNYIRNHPVEIDIFLDKFTINYTYFFRNFSVYENVEKFIKIYTNQSNKKFLRIWSAPCATGDEPYTIAMILDQLKNKNKKFPEFEIVASDIDPTALKEATEGIYGEYPVHETPELYLKSYFTKEDTELGPKFTISEDIKKKVEFIQEDIIKGHKKKYKYDVIFCRNLFIYINQFAREKLLNILDSHLFDGGLLILGGSETLPRKNSSFKSINMKDRFYVKNLINQNVTYRNRICNLFNQSKDAKIERRKQTSKGSNKSVKAEVKNIQEKTKTIERPKKIPKGEEILEIESKKKGSKSEIENLELTELEKIEAEVKITGIEINSGFNGNFAESKNNQLKEPTRKPLSNTRKEELRKRELILEQREKVIDERIAYLDEKYENIENKRKEISKLAKKVKQQELEVKNRIGILERLTKQVEQREKLVEQKEKQFNSRIKQVGEYTRQAVHQEVQINGSLKNTFEDRIDTNKYDEERLDRVDNPNRNKELIIPMGYYGLINSFDQNEAATKFIIPGLGSGIALILKDPVNNIFAMSHISLPSSSSSKQGYHLLFPHTFIDTSVKDLYNDLIYHGANGSYITALIVGGAKLFLDYDMTYQENINAIKKELEVRKIEIIAKDLGGISERAIIYDTINDTLQVKKTWEFEYRRII